MMETPPSLPQPQQRASHRGLLVAAGTALVLVLFGSLVRLPIYTLGPGPARDVAGLIRVTGERDTASKGSFLLTTVSVSSRGVTLFEAVRGWLDSSVEVVRRSEIVGPGLTDRQQDVANAQAMETSKYDATVVAMRALGLDVKPIPGARVIFVVPDTPAAGKLKAGDVIVAVDGTGVLDVEAAVQAVRRRGIGARVRLGVRRGRRTKTIVLRTVESPARVGTPVIGAVLVPALKLPAEVMIDTADIGGPSGGLVFALATADVLSPGDLTRGHHIAATGTIDEKGDVGPVGGVSLKVEAAERAGADIFLVPKGEVTEARSAAKRLRVIGVETLRGALRVLRSLDVARPAA